MRRLLLLAALLGGCAGERLATSAEGCWGAGASGTGACRDARIAVVHALGGGGIVPTGSCGAVIDCATAPPPPTPRPTPPPVRGNDTPAATPGPVATRETPPPASATPVGTPPPSMTPPPAWTPEPTAQTPPPATPTPTATATPATPPPPTPTPKVASAGPDPGAAAKCAGMDITTLAGKAALADGEVSCLVAATGKDSGFAEADVQTAAIALYNVKASGWAKAVEDALARSGLKNAPRLNLAGIKSAYDGGKHATVLVRARATWKGMTNGFALSTAERTFVTEFACRASGQLVLGGKDTPSDALEWCERWLDLANRAGAPTGEIEDLIRQVE